MSAPPVHEDAALIEAEVAAMAAERIGSGLRDEEADWTPFAVDWRSDGAAAQIDLEGGLRLELTVTLTRM